MSSKIREFQSFLYILGAAIGVVLFVLTSNELIFNSTALPRLTSLGNWGYWVFTLSLIMMVVFFYFYYKVIRDARRFEELINSESKNIFSKNLKELEKISRKLGPRYVSELRSTKEKWKIR